MHIKHNDFIWDNKKLSNFNLQIVEFDDKSDEDFFEQELFEGERTRFRNAGNYLGNKSGEAMEFEIHVVSLNEGHPITRDEVRAVTKWLTGSQHRKWLVPLKLDDTQDSIRYHGVFTSVKKWDKTNKVNGLILTFRNKSQFAYSHDIVSNHSINGQQTIKINNDSDDMNTPNYPRLKLVTTQFGEQHIYICNLSDSIVLREGVINSAGSASDLLGRLEQQIHSHATLRGYKTFLEDSWCSGTLITFRYTAPDASVRKCSAFVNPDTGRFYIIQGGLLLLKLRMHLEIFVDCERMSIRDGIGRMVPLKELGVNDVDWAYFPKLVSGENELIVYGNQVNMEITRTEERAIATME